jgi:hypothetical protein
MARSVTTYFAVSSLSVREKKTGGGAVSRADPERQDRDDGSAHVGGVRRRGRQLRRGLLRQGAGADLEVPGQVQITLTKMRLAAESEIDPADFQPTTRFDIDEMWAELRGYVDAFANADLRRLVFAFLDDPRDWRRPIARRAGGEGAAPCVDRRAAGACADAGARLPGDGAVLSRGGCGPAGDGRDPARHRQGARAELGDDSFSYTLEGR